MSRDIPEGSSVHDRGQIEDWLTGTFLEEVIADVTARTPTKDETDSLGGGRK